MVGNNFVYTQFQKRRRRSNPPSPTSPTFTRRLVDKQGGYLHVSSPADLASASTANSESPSLDINVPSPTFDISSSFSPISPTKDIQSTNNTRLARSSDEYGQYRYPSVLEPTRPATSAATAPMASKSYQATAASPSTSSPSYTQSMRPSFEHLGGGTHPQEWRSRFSDQQGLTLRNFSTSSLTTDRSIVEDSASSKNFAPKKSRFHLRNPMGLLARRKSSQLGKDEDTDLTINTRGLAPLPKGDVSIRGTKVHDFNAPRPHRIYSQNNISSGENSPLVESRPSIQSQRRSSDLPNIPSSPPHRLSQSPKHSPMFKEHFNDDTSVLQPGQTAYLHSLAAAQSMRSETIPSNMPPFAKRLPTRLPEEQNTGVSIKQRRGRFEGQSTIRPVIAVPEDDIQHEETSPQAPTPPPQVAPSPDLDEPSTSQLPKHMTSTSSRFSFQIGGQGSSAQERLLEERHKQHQASKKLANIDGADEVDEDDFGDYDFDDDGLEERIPGINADAEDYTDDLEEPIPGVNADAEDYTDDLEEPIPGVNADAEDYYDDLEEPIPGVNADVEDYNDDLEESVPGINTDSGPKMELQPQLPFLATKTETPNTTGYDGFSFTPQAALFSPGYTLSGSLPTPRDEKGCRIGVADTKDSPGLFQPMQNPHLTDETEEHPSVNGLGISALQSSVEPTVRLPSQIPLKITASFDDEDLYFDDGDFDEILREEHNAFDEDIFDDETGKIHDIPAQNAKRLEEVQRAHVNAADPPALDRLSFSEEKKKQLQSSHSRSASEESVQISTAPDAPRLSASVGVGAHSSLTEDNLQTYHDALVAAANEAAAKGRFNRNVSFSQRSEDQSSQSQLDDSQQALTSDESRISHNFDPSGIAEDDGFPFDDDAYEDDLMIAEANAEVLENDDDGFYGQEFGFYARAKGKGSSDLTNGGYFGPRGTNGIKRSHSAKNNFQEPSLTPITERSEWSTRNSIISVKIPGIPGSAASIPSPSLAHYMDVDSGSYEDPEMSLSAFVKLRGRAFGASSTSINSVGASLPGSSPLAYVSHHGLLNIDTNHRMASSIHSLTSSAGIPESEEEQDDHMELPTLTQSTPIKKRSDPSPATPQNYAMSPSLGATDSRNKISHNRTSSAESVSYVRDPDGSGRWLLERRRTGDDGELEVIGREYLAGARI